MLRAFSTQTCAARHSMAASANTEAAHRILLFPGSLARRRQYRCHGLAEGRRIPLAALQLDHTPAKRQCEWAMSLLGPSRHFGLMP
jgi:hypothetical protein